MIINKILASLAGLVLLLSAYVSGLDSGVNTNRVLGGAANGLPAVIATSSQPTVGTTAVALWSAGNSNGNCSSRVISTQGKAIMLSFGDRPNYPAGNRATTTVSGTLGFLQAASTTVTYDASVYGCGSVSAYGFDSSTTITIAEFR
mgnify:FL=1